jgi:hypothetical protein
MRISILPELMNYSIVTFQMDYTIITFNRTTHSLYRCRQFSILSIGFRAVARSKTPHPASDGMALPRRIAPTLLPGALALTLL